MSDTPPTYDRCGSCLNCQHIERVQARVLSILTFPGKGHGADAAALWNRELAASPCVADCVHAPLWSSISFAPLRGGRPIIDVSCERCGASGAFAVEALDIDW